MPRYIFHLIGTAHIDPVWLWDWREGLNEGLITCRANLNLLDEDPEVCFCRGEAAIYRHILETDPVLFERIKAYVRTGRWEIAGGTFVQSDENLPDTETLIRQFTRGQRFFAKHFGKPAVTGWSADCFGHTGGLPAILNAAGVLQFCFTRPLKPECPLPGPAFWWDGPGGSRVLAYRPHCDWYCIELAGMIARLDQTLRQAVDAKQHAVAVLYGLGNHGGGPTRRHLREIRQWGAQHSEVELRFSTFNRFFEALRAEIAEKGDSIVGRHTGEIQACERGVYTSMAKLKFLYRRAAAQLTSAEATSASISAMLNSANLPAPTADLTAAWDSILFNSFHDILPGTCIERAAESQIAQLGGALREGENVSFAAINALAQAVDTRVPPAVGDDFPTAVAFLVFNPLPVPFDGLVEIEGTMDSRPIWKYEGRPDDMPARLLDADRQPLPFQSIALESKSHMNLPWRKRVLAPLTVPAMGWTVVELGYVEGAAPPAWPEGKRPATWTGDGIENDSYRVEAWIGATGVRLLHKGKEVFGPHGFRAETYEDPWGSWGGPESEVASWDLATVVQTWTVTNVRMIEKGPYRAVMWVRLSGGKSRLDLMISLSAGREVVDLKARVFWDQPNERLKLIFPGAEEADFEVPGGHIHRGRRGDVPGRRWVRVATESGGFCFISDSLSGFDCRDGALKASVVRSSHYAFYGKSTGEWPWLPAIDAGELKFNFLIAPMTADPWALAERLDKPVVTLPVQPCAGPLGRAGSLLSIEPATVRLLALKPAEEGDGWIIRLQETTGQAACVSLTLLNHPVELGDLAASGIASWRVAVKASVVTATPCTATELNY